MTQFKNVTIEQKANTYFDGKVSSRTVYLTKDEKITLGFMSPGEYEFGTAKQERMEIVAGELTVLLPNDTDWQTFVAGQAFEVPANSTFQAKTTTFADYTCYYLNDV